MSGLTDREIVRRILRAGLREEPGPYRCGLALKEWAKIQKEQRQTEADAIARYHGIGEDKPFTGEW